MRKRSRLTGLAFALGLILTGSAFVIDLHAAGVPSEERRTPLVQAVQRVQSSVVNIHTEKTTVERTSLFPSGKNRKINGMGTGLVIDPRGYIVTNHHVVAEVDTLRCVMSDGATYHAQVVAYDKEHDLAIIKVNPSGKMEVAPFGTSSDLMLGETVVAIGNAYGYEHTVTCGIVSHLSRDVDVNEFQSYKNLIQTDASINPGNSGGPLLNLDGEVVGINVAIRAGAQRIGFAIPMDDARRHIAAMFNAERIGKTRHGLKTRDVKDGSDRYLVVESVPGADDESLRKGDVITRVDGLDIIDRVDLERAVIGIPVGDKVEVAVKRGDEELTFELPVQSTNERTAMMASAQKATIRGNNSRPTGKKARGRSWSMLGLELSPMVLNVTMADGTRYRGGMLITEVRDGSPAAENGIAKGDVLVGLHEWEMVSGDNVSYVLEHPQLQSFAPLRFYILRGRETLFGHMKLASTASP